MRAEFEPVADRLVYRLLDVDPAYDAVLRMCFWDRDDLGWHRRYPRDAADVGRASARFAAQCEEMFAQLAYLRPIPWEQALLAFADRAARHGLGWWLTGSVSACIRGIPLDPHDVDVMIDGRDATLFADAFCDYLVEPIVDTEGWLTKDFGVLFWHARIDIASDPSPALDQPTPADCGPFARDHLEQVDYRGRAIRVPPLDLLAATNRRRGRTGRAELIERAISQ